MSSISTLPSVKPTLLFIPDISGFTQFVNETEISHSQHIIEELLEILIDANELTLKVSEIEGDAILFYREGKSPSSAELLSQLQQMYTKFHAHLRKYETHRICQCGACSTAHELTLKFVIHYGPISKKQVKEHSKLFGKDVIVAHRLMKNEVPENEYALFTESLMASCESWKEVSLTGWAEPVSQTGTYDFGTIDYCYLPLKALRKHIPEPDVKDFSGPDYQQQLLHTESVIEAPLELAFSVLADLTQRENWHIESMKHMEIGQPINQLHGSHRCVANGPVLYTHGFDRGKDMITYSETDGNFVNIVYTLRRIGKGLTSMHVDTFSKKNLIKGLVFRLIFRKKVVSSLKQSLANLNALCKELFLAGKDGSHNIVIAKEVM